MRIVSFIETSSGWEAILLPSTQFGGGNSYEGRVLCIESFGGNRGDVPVVGDWTGDGKDKIGIYRSGQWILDKNGNGLLEDCTIDLCIESIGGYRGDIPVVGDWNNDGRDKIGIYRTGQWLLDYDGDGIWDGCESDVCIDALGGSRGDVAVVARHPKTF